MVKVSSTSPAAATSGSKVLIEEGFWLPLDHCHESVEGEVKVGAEALESCDRKSPRDLISSTWKTPEYAPIQASLLSYITSLVFDFVTFVTSVILFTVQPLRNPSYSSLKSLSPSISSCVYDRASIQVFKIRINSCIIKR
jgi:hypothetical protein